MKIDFSLIKIIFSTLKLIFLNKFQFFLHKLMFSQENYFSSLFYFCSQENSFFLAIAIFTQTFDFPLQISNFSSWKLTQSRIFHENTTERFRVQNITVPRLLLLFLSFVQQRTLGDFFNIFLQWYSLAMCLLLALWWFIL